MKILDDKSGDIQLDYLYSFPLDITDTKLYASKKMLPIPKYTLPINVDNKTVELIRISQILNHPEILETLSW